MGDLVVAIVATSGFLLIKTHCIDFIWNGRFVRYRRDYICFVRTKEEDKTQQANLFDTANVLKNVANVAENVVNICSL